MLSMPRIVRPDPFGIGPPLDRHQVDPFSETKNWPKFRPANSCVNFRDEPDAILRGLYPLLYRGLPRRMNKALVRRGPL